MGMTGCGAGVAIGSIVLEVVLLVVAMAGRSENIKWIVKENLGRKRLI